MFVYKLPNGVLRETMTVSELIVELGKHDPGLPVFGGWEGVRGCINSKSFEESDGCLLIDVEEFI